MSFQPSKRRHGNDIPDEPLNLIPVMNLLTILIPFLTLTAVFMRISVLPTSLPSVSDESDAPAEEEQEEDDKPKLNLTVSINADGFYVAGSGGVLSGQEPGEPTISLTDEGDYNYDALTEKLVDVKKEFPHESDVILIPEMRIGEKTKDNVEIPYQVVIDTMDAVRRAPEPVVDSDEDGEKDDILFPGVIFSPGIL